MPSELRPSSISASTQKMHSHKFSVKWLVRAALFEFIVRMLCREVGTWIAALVLGTKVGMGLCLVKGQRCILFCREAGH